MKKKLQVNQNGFAVLIAIIVVGAATLIMAYSSSILSMGELELGYYSQKGGEAFAIADGCMEESMRRLKVDPGYSGETLNLGNGSCTISIVPSGSDRTITVTGSVDNYNKKIEVNITLSGQDIIVNSWEELTS
jgi:hypothetical protein